MPEESREDSDIRPSGTTIEEATKPRDKVKTAAAPFTLNRDPARPVQAQRKTTQESEGKPLHFTRVN